MRKSLLLGSDFAAKMGDAERASSYKSTAEYLEKQLADHWTGS
jgi:hypothetical protein